MSNAPSVADRQRRAVDQEAHQFRLARDGRLTGALIQKGNVTGLAKDAESRFDVVEVSQHVAGRAKPDRPGLWQNDLELAGHRGP